MAVQKRLCKQKTTVSVVVICFEPGKITLESLPCIENLSRFKNRISFSPIVLKEEGVGVGVCVLVCVCVGGCVCVF